MATLDEILKRQQEGARFVISAAMLGMPFDDFDTLVQTWISTGVSGFALEGVPHRKCIDGEFYIDRITVRRET